MSECDLYRALESHRTQGDCKEGYKTILIKVNEYYSPAEEDIRLWDIFPSSAGYINLTKLPKYENTKRSDV